jgi:hypothetical protein
MTCSQHLPLDAALPVRLFDALVAVAALRMHQYGVFRTHRES